MIRAQDGTRLFMITARLTVEAAKMRPQIKSRLCRTVTGTIRSALEQGLQCLFRFTFRCLLRCSSRSQLRSWCAGLQSASAWDRRLHTRPRRRPCAHWLLSHAHLTKIRGITNSTMTHNSPTIHASGSHLYERHDSPRVVLHCTLRNTVSRCCAR